MPTYAFPSGVQETTATTGTGTLTLAGATSGHSALNGLVAPSPAYCPYRIEQRDASGNVQAWSYQIGQFTPPNQLSRGTLVRSSTGAALNLSASYTTYVYPVALGEAHGITDFTTVSGAEAVDVITDLDVSTATFARARRTLGDAGTFDAALLAGRTKTGYVRSTLANGDADGALNTIVYGAIGDRPAAAAGNDKWLYITTDETPPGYYYSNGSAWTNIAPFVHAISAFVGVGSYADKASLPAAATANRYFLQRDLGLLKRDTGAAIEAALNKITGSGVLSEAGSYVAFGDWALCLGREASTTSRAPTGYTKTFTFPITYASAPLVVPLVHGAASGDIGNITGQGAVSTSTTQTTIVVAIPSTNAEIALGYAAFGPVTTL